MRIQNLKKMHYSFFSQQEVIIYIYPLYAYMMAILKYFKWLQNRLVVFCMLCLFRSMCCILMTVYSIYYHVTHFNCIILISHDVKLNYTCKNKDIFKITSTFEFVVLIWFFFTYSKIRKKFKMGKPF